MMGVKLSLDIGDARIGIAKSEPLLNMAFPLETYVRKPANPNLDYQHIASLCLKHQIDAIIIGMPYNMDGTEGIRAQKTRQFASELKTFIDIETVFQDERLTSVEAERILEQNGKKRKNSRMIIDQIAATIILQDYLDRQSRLNI
jgi:putative Holliday junction resolvase